MSYTFEEIQYAWEEADISGDWFEFISHLGSTPPQDEKKQVGVFEQMGLDSLRLPTLSRQKTAVKAKALATDLMRMVTDHGDDVEVVLQDSPPLMHPDLCKHSEFFIVEESIAGTENDIEIVLRTWPY